MKIREIPRELLDVWYEKYDRLYIVPATPRHNKKWSPGFWSRESIMIGINNYGYCQVIPVSNDELYLFFIYIEPQFRCKGHGRGFMKKLIKLSQELNYEKISLDVGYLNPKDKVPAPILRKFYGDLGFKREKGTKMVLDINQL